MHCSRLPETVLSLFLQRLIAVVATHRSNQSKSINCHVIHLFLDKHPFIISLQPASIKVDNVHWFWNSEIWWSENQNCPWVSSVSPNYQRERTITVRALCIYSSICVCVYVCVCLRMGVGSNIALDPLCRPLPPPVPHTHLATPGAHCDRCNWVSGFSIFCPATLVLYNTPSMTSCHLREWYSKTPCCPLNRHLILLPTIPFFSDQEKVS